MDNKGTCLICDNATDSTGYYIYRKDGKRDGECWGMDFEKARQDYKQGKCVTGSKPCKDSLLSTCVCLIIIPILHAHLDYAFKVPTCFDSDTCRS